MDIDDAASDVFSTTSEGPPSSVAYSNGRTMTTASSYEIDPATRSNSPMSVISLTDSMRETILYRHEYGRGLNNYSEIYRLPVDDEEFERLDIQHAMFVDIMGGKYAPPMADVMRDDIPGETKACLDLGCGSGSWILDVAHDFPNCSAVAVDLIPMQASVMPPNLRSEVDDINLGLEHFYGDFNVVHTRLIASGIRDYHLLIDQIAQVLRPGGLIDIAETDRYLYDSNRQRFDVDTNELGPPWCARWMAFLRAATQDRGAGIDAATHLHRWVSENPNFEDIVSMDYWLPMIPPIREDAEQSDSQRRFLRRMKTIVTGFLRSGRPMLLGSGVPEHIVDEMESNSLKEMAEARLPQYTRIQRVYARKRSN
ncbi:hypothetical protein M413DRAFT_448286 [Hebeloma cylindrosporum]|uniref:Methyltransferase domain-containing protein n=1 Tax=Hebeloma cylindrosporum TaxID=76867 RepID=A0A0C3C0G9_HEBCY|nr:hypothetical protein M413DRAFT_448286 [Hebeloma cylindrosporum h7]